jgi:hypothetical protein
MQRFLSRKFIMALAAQLTGLAVLIWPQQEGPIAQGIQSAVALVVVVLSALGYLSAEASVDRANVQQSDNP